MAGAATFSLGAGWVCEVIQAGLWVCLEQLPDPAEWVRGLPVDVNRVRGRARRAPRTGDHPASTHDRRRARADAGRRPQAGVPGRAPWSAAKRVRPRQVAARPAAGHQRGRVARPDGSGRRGNHDVRAGDRRSGHRAQRLQQPRHGADEPDRDADPGRPRLPARHVADRTARPSAAALAIPQRHARRAPRPPRRAAPRAAARRRPRAGAPADARLRLTAHAAAPGHAAGAGHAGRPWRPADAAHAAAARHAAGSRVQHADAGLRRPADDPAHAGTAGDASAS